MNTTAIGNATVSDAEGATAIGNSANALGEHATALGDASNASANNALAAGYTAQAQGANSLAIGNASQATEENTISIGDNTSASAKNAMSMGTASSASAENTIALGNSSKASDQNATAIGNTAEATGNDSLAVGNGAKATDAYSVALGTGSKTSSPIGTSEATIGKLTYGNFAGNDPLATVSVGNEDQARTITHLAAGRVESTSTDAINGSQLYAVANTVNSVATSNVSLLGGNASVSPDGSISMSNIGDTGKNTINEAIKASRTEVKAGDNIQVTTSKGLDDHPIYTVATVDTPDFKTVTSNEYKVGNTTYINSDGINANNQKITHVANGDVAPGSTDAVNGGQLYQSVSGIDNKINSLGNRVNKVGAGAAALAALHPLDFDPDDKWNVAVGYGNYKNANAMAVGAFYRPNEDTMFSVSGSMGNGENMINAGISLKLGQKNGVSTTRVAMAREIASLNNRLQTMEDNYNKLLSLFNLENKENFPDVPENHWAYEYVSTLAGNGIITGYPDGTFKGDQLMTRYEFATMLYKALQNGVNPNDKDMARAINEFEPELDAISLKHIRIDRISGKNTDRHKVERVRVNNEIHKDSNDYRDIYGSSIPAPKSK